MLNEEYFGYLFNVDVGSINYSEFSDSNWEGVHMIPVTFSTHAAWERFKTLTNLSPVRAIDSDAIIDTMEYFKDGHDGVWKLIKISYVGVTLVALGVLGLWGIETKYRVFNNPPPPEMDWDRFMLLRKVCRITVTIGALIFIFSTYQIRVNVTESLVEFSEFLSK